MPTTIYSPFSFIMYYSPFEFTKIAVCFPVFKNFLGSRSKKYRIQIPGYINWSRCFTSLAVGKPGQSICHPFCLLLKVRRLQMFPRLIFNWLLTYFQRITGTVHFSSLSGFRQLFKDKSLSINFFFIYLQAFCFLP